MERKYENVDNFLIANNAGLKNNLEDKYKNVIDSNITF